MAEVRQRWRKVIGNTGIMEKTSLVILLYHVLPLLMIRVLLQVIL